MKKITLVLLFVVWFGVSAHNAEGQTNPAAQALPYNQDFSGLAHTSTTYPAGWQGWTISTSPGATFSTAGPTADRALVASSTAAINSGNVHNYNGKIGYLNSASLDLTLVLAINTTGLTGVGVTYDIMTIRNPYDVTTNTLQVEGRHLSNQWRRRRCGRRAGLFQRHARGPGKRLADIYSAA